VTMDLRHAKYGRFGKKTNSSCVARYNSVKV
jgi:hypothetical protein